MLFIDCDWVSTRWQWSVNLYKIRKETAKMEKQYTKKYQNNIKTQNTQNIKKNTKEEDRYKKNIKKEHVE